MVILAMADSIERLVDLRGWFHREGFQAPAEIVLASRDDHVALFMRLRKGSEYAAIGEQVGWPKVGVPDSFEVMGIRFRSPEPTNTADRSWEVWREVGEFLRKNGWHIEKRHRPWKPVEAEEDLPMLHRISAGRD